MSIFNVKSEFEPAGDQINAIKELSDGIKKGYKAQTLKGVTGSGKTFTMAKIIEKPDCLLLSFLIIRHSQLSSTESSLSFFLIMLLNTLFPIMIIISRKPMYHQKTSI